MSRRDPHPRCSNFRKSLTGHSTYPAAQGPQAGALLGQHDCYCIQVTVDRPGTISRPAREAAIVKELSIYVRSRFCRLLRAPEDQPPCQADRIVREQRTSRPAWRAKPTAAWEFCACPTPGGAATLTTPASPCSSSNPSCLSRGID